MYFVCIKYVLDGVKKTVLSSSIKDFNPENVDDFDADCIYECWWRGDDRTRAGFYDAKIITMTDSKEEMDEYLEKRRGAAPTKQRKTSKQEAVRPSSAKL
ncbi:hypothetical protein ISCGN_023224 [Ixodes scapularis]